MPQPSAPTCALLHPGNQIRPMPFLLVLNIVRANRYGFPPVSEGSAWANKVWADFCVRSDRKVLPQEALKSSEVLNKPLRKLARFERTLFHVTTGLRMCYFVVPKTSSISPVMDRRILAVELKFVEADSDEPTIMGLYGFRRAERHRSFRHFIVAEKVDPDD